MTGPRATAGPRAPAPPSASARTRRVVTQGFARVVTQGFARAFTVALALTCSAAPWTNSAAADQLRGQLDEARGSVEPVTERSFEAAVDASDPAQPRLRVRVTLHNASALARDFVHVIGLPAGATLLGLRIAPGHDPDAWQPGRATSLVRGSSRRDPQTVWARLLPPERPGQLPAAQVVGFALEPDTAVRIELTVAIAPVLRGDRWELLLGARGVDLLGLARERSVTVEGLAPGERFWVDGRPNPAGQPVTTRGVDGVVVAWRANTKAAPGLAAALQITRLPSAPGSARDATQTTQDGTTVRTRAQADAREPASAAGEFELQLRLGASEPLRPDHVVVLIDRSRSAVDDLGPRAQAMLDVLFAALPASTTFELIGFDRAAQLLLPAVGHAPLRSGSPADRAALALALGQLERTHGTNVAAGLDLAARRLEGTTAKRPLVLIVTDGAFPSGANRRPLRDEARRRLASARPGGVDLLMVVDDPLTHRTGLGPDHVATMVATELGARVAVVTLTDLRDADELLAAPPVLDELQISLPSGAAWIDEPPEGLAAGGRVVLRGSFARAPLRPMTLRGRWAGRAVQRTVRATAAAPPPAALVASFDADRTAAAAAEGFTRPEWYDLDADRHALRMIAQADRGAGEQRGRLDPSVIGFYLRTRVMPRARVCFNQALVRDPLQSGTVAFEFELGRGELMWVRTVERELALPDEVLERCLDEAAWALEVPAGRLDDATYLVRYPLRLVPPRDGVGARVRDPSTDRELRLLLGESVAAPAAAARAADKRRAAARASDAERATPTTPTAD